MSCQNDYEGVQENLGMINETICELENTVPQITKDEALKIIEPIAGEYSDRWIDISNETISSGSIVDYIY